MANSSQVETKGISQLINIIFRIGLVAYLALLLFASLWPTPVDGGGFIWWITSEILKFCQGIDWLSWIRYNQLEAIANMLLYLPLGIFLVKFFPRLPFWLALISPVLVSVIAEGIQRFLLPARYSTVDDVINNAIGGAAGVLIATGIRRLRKPKR